VKRVDECCEIYTFGKVIELFKQEIEIRAEYENLPNIFEKIQDYMDESDFDVILPNKDKLNKQFYTDVESFTYALDKVFSEIKKRTNFKEIEVSMSYPDSDYYELKITHIDSYATQKAEDLLQQINDGDFADIKSNLTNLCDWSIVNSFEDKNFRINYLKSNNIKDIEPLDEKPRGFTHILKFYK